MRLVTNSCLATAALVLPAVAAAAPRDDATPPIIFHADGARIAVDRAEAVVDGDTVHIRLLTKPADAPASLTLHIPRFGWVDGSAIPIAAPALKVELDGSSGKVKRRIVARAGAADVTNALDAADLDPMAANATGTPLKTHGKAPALDSLKAAGAIAPSGSGYLPRWNVEGDLVMRLDPKRGHRIDIGYTARPHIAAISRNDLIKTVQWADYCLSDEGAVRLTNRLVPGDVRKARQYAIPVAIDAEHPDNVRFELRPRKGEKTFVAFCGYRGPPAVSPPGPVAAGVSADGQIKVIVLSVPKRSGEEPAGAAPVQPLPPPDASATPEERYRYGLQLLQQGGATQARAIFAQLQRERPRDRRIGGLIEQIDADPQQLYGSDSFAYSVQEGDTLTILARKYLKDGTKFYGLARYNHLDLPTELQPGQTLLIPGRPRAPQRAIVTAPRTGTPSAPAPTSPQRPRAPVAAKSAEPPKPAPPAPSPPAPPPPSPPPAPAPAAPAKTDEAQRLRREGLIALSGGATGKAVELLSQAAGLAPGDRAIADDLARAKRIQATVRSR